MSNLISSYIMHVRSCFVNFGVSNKHIDRLSELVSDKLSICLSAFVRIFRSLSVLVIRLSAKPTKLQKILNNQDVPEDVCKCAIDCHGDCEFCANH